MSHHDGYSGGHLLLAFLGGAAAGAAIALLTAPRSGAETRQMIAGSIAAKRDEIARLPPALRAAYEAATAAARDAYKQSLEKNQAAAGKDEA
ncbi:MAG: YtxH domain-containing protein [bacterium]